MEKKKKIVGASCIAPFALSLVAVAVKSGVPFAILVAIFAVLAVYGVGVLMDKFPVPFIKVPVTPEAE